MKLIRVHVKQLSAKNRAWDFPTPDDDQEDLHQRLPGTFEPVPGWRVRTQEAGQEEENQQFQQFFERLHEHAVSTTFRLFNMTARVIHFYCGNYLNVSRTISIDSSSH